MEFPASCACSFQPPGLPRVLAAGAPARNGSPRSKVNEFGEISVNHPPLSRTICSVGSYAITAWQPRILRCNQGQCVGLCDFTQGLYTDFPQAFSWRNHNGS